MNKFVSSTLAGAALCFGAGAFAQASNFDDYQSKSAPVARAYGSDSGYVPEAAANGYNHNLYPFGIDEYSAPFYRDRRVDRWGRTITRRNRDRDRDGDGVANRDDRHPDNPRRW